MLADHEFGRDTDAKFSCHCKAGTKEQSQPDQNERTCFQHVNYLLVFP